MGNDILLPVKPRRENPEGFLPVQTNVEYLASLFQVGTVTGDIPVWDNTLGKFVAQASAVALSTTTLPAAPVDGQEAFYQSAAMATPGMVWHFRYRAGSGSAYKWEFVGGPPLFAEVIAQETASAQIFGDLTTVGPTVTLPLAGDYDVEIGAWSRSADFADLVGKMSYEIGRAHV